MTMQPMQCLSTDCKLQNNTLKLDLHYNLIKLGHFISAITFQLLSNSAKHPVHLRV